MMRINFILKYFFLLQVCIFGYAASATELTKDTLNQEVVLFRGTVKQFEQLSENLGRGDSKIKKLKIISKETQQGKSFQHSLGEIYSKGQEVVEQSAIYDKNQRTEKFVAHDEGQEGVEQSVIYDKSLRIKQSDQEAIKCVSLLENIEYSSAQLISGSEMMSYGEGKEDIFYFFGEKLCENKHLISLDMSHTGINDYVVAKICWALRTGKEFPLRILNLSHNPLFNRVGHSLEEALKVNSRLKELYLDGTCLEDEGVTLIADGLCDGSSLELLSLSSNKISNSGAISLGKMIMRNKNLKTLNLALNKIEFQGFGFLTFGVSNNTNLQILNLESNNIIFPDSAFEEEEEEANKKASAEFFNLNRLSLNELRIGGNRLGDNQELHDRSLINISSSLNKVTSLQKLSLSNSSLNDDNFDETLGELLSGESFLQFLDLSFNEISDGGAKTLASYLDDTKNLTEIDLSNNKITDKGFQHLFKALEKGEKLNILRLDNNLISSEKLKSLENLVLKKKNLSIEPILTSMKQPITILQQATSQGVNVGGEGQY